MGSVPFSNVCHLIVDMLIVVIYYKLLLKIGLLFTCNTSMNKVEPFYNLKTPYHVGDPTNVFFIEV